MISESLRYTVNCVWSLHIRKSLSSLKITQLLNNLLFIACKLWPAVWSVGHWCFLIEDTYVERCASYQTMVGDSKTVPLSLSIGQILSCLGNENVYILFL